MKNLLEIASLSCAEIERLIHTALALKKESKISEIHQNKKIAQLFYENSTRTKISFERAIQNLKIPYVNVDIATSSENKGENIFDTVRTLEAMGFDIFIMRHKSNNLIFELAEEFKGAHFINAGSGMRAHPTQALLDLLTLVEDAGSIEAVKELSITLLGDLKHSRVVASLLELLSCIGVKDVRLVSPEFFSYSKTTMFPRLHDMKQGLNGADVIMCFRVQKERFDIEEAYDLRTYIEAFSLNSEHLSYAKPKALVMHPGPMNRGIEITSEVADSQQSLIWKQVYNGVWLRQAVIKTIIERSSKQ